MAQVDPRTNLPILPGMPPPFKKFHGLDCAVVHWIGEVESLDKNWKPTQQILVLTDECCYVCDPSTKVNRCIRAANISDLLVSGDSLLGVRVRPPDYDILLRFRQARDTVVNYLMVLAKYHTDGAEPVLSTLPLEVGTSLEGILRLDPPPEWELHIEPITNKQTLTEKLAQQRQFEAQLGRRLDPIVADELTNIMSVLKQQLEEQFNTELSDLRNKVQEQEAELDYYRRGGVGDGAPGEVERLRKQVAQLQAKLDKSTTELTRVKKAWSETLDMQKQEMDMMQEKFLEYDRETVAYLNKVYSAFPTVRPSVGSPPMLKTDKKAPPPSPLHQANSHSLQPSDDVSELSYHGSSKGSKEKKHDATPPKMSTPASWIRGIRKGLRIPAAEARRDVQQKSRAVSGGFGPGGIS